MHIFANSQHRPSPLSKYPITCIYFHLSLPFFYSPLCQTRDPIWKHLSNPPLSPPHRRRINSASSSNIEDYHEPHANEPSAAPIFLASNDTLHLDQNTVNTRPISPIPTRPKSPIPQHELTPNDLLAAMREQQIFITNQQSMFQQEHDYNRNAL